MAMIIAACIIAAAILIAAGYGKTLSRTIRVLLRIAVIGALVFLILYAVAVWNEPLPRP